MADILLLPKTLSLHYYSPPTCRPTSSYQDTTRRLVATERRWVRVRRRRRARRKTFRFEVSIGDHSQKFLTIFRNPSSKSERRAQSPRISPTQASRRNVKSPPTIARLNIGSDILQSYCSRSAISEYGRTFCRKPIHPSFVTIDVPVR